MIPFDEIDEVFSKCEQHNNTIYTLILDLDFVVESGWRKNEEAKHRITWNSRKRKTLDFVQQMAKSLGG